MRQWVSLVGRGYRRAGSRGRSPHREDQTDPLPSMNRDITDTKATPTSQLGMGSPSERRPESLGATDEAAPVSPQDRLRLRTGRTLRRWTREVRPMCSLAFPIMSGMLAHM